MNRLLRITLALVLAFVLAGRMQAAAQHCARLAGEASAIAAVEPACHMTGMAMPALEKAKPDRHHAPNGPCECVAFAQGFTPEAPLQFATRLQQVAWARPAAEQVASLDLAPDRPPPKA